MTTPGNPTNSTPPQAPSNPPRNPVNPRNVTTPALEPGRNLDVPEIPGHNG